MKKKLLKLLGTIITIIIIAGFKMSARTNPQCPFKINVDGTEISVNKIHVDDLKKMGYKLSDSSYFGMHEKVEKRTYAAPAASINKDGMMYADISAINFSDSTKNISDCRVYEMKFFYSNQSYMGKEINTYKEAVIDGFNPSGMTKDQVKEKVTKKVTKDEDKELTVEDKDYYCTYRFDDNGMVDTVEVGIPVYKLKAA